MPEGGLDLQSPLRGTLHSQHHHLVPLCLLQVEFDELLAAKAVKSTFGDGYRALLRRDNRPQLFFAVVMAMFQQLTGFNAVLFYVSALLQDIGFTVQSSLWGAVDCGIILTIGAMVGLAAVDTFGRRALLLEGGVQMLIMQVCPNEQTANECCHPSNARACHEPEASSLLSLNWRALCAQGLLSPP